MRSLGADPFPSPPTNQPSSGGKSDSPKPCVKLGGETYRIVFRGNSDEAQRTPMFHSPFSLRINSFASPSHIPALQYIVEFGFGLYVPLTPGIAAPSITIIFSFVVHFVAFGVPTFELSLCGLGA